MNTPLVETLRGMDDDEKEIQIGEMDGSPVKFNVGPLDKAAGKLLHNIKAIFGEAANDPDWVLALLHASAFWLTLGCSLGEDDSQEAVVKGTQPVAEIPPIPKRFWNG